MTVYSNHSLDRVESDPIIIDVMLNREGKHEPNMVTHFRRVKS